MGTTNRNGQGYYLTDEEFIAKWKENPSPTLMAQASGFSVRAVQNRRRNIEIRHKIELPTTVDLMKEHNEKQKKEKLARQEANKAKLEEAPVNVRRGIDLDKGRIIVFSDAHFWPDDTTTAYKALLKFIEYFKPNVIVNNGDSFDGGSISRFPRIGWDKKPTVLEELEANKFYLGEIEKIRPAGCRLIHCLGNHDARFETLLAAQASAYEGVHGFHLKDHFPLWEGCWSFWVNDDTVIKHRLKGGRYAGYNNAIAAQTNIITGHTHVLACQPITGYAKTIWGVQTGTLANPDGLQFADYTEDACKDWRQGFVMLSWDRGRMLMPEMIQVCGENEVEFRGEILQV
jgi:predicted phosphodiesterase